VRGISGIVGQLDTRRVEKRPQHRFIAQQGSALTDRAGLVMTMQARSERHQTLLLPLDDLLAVTREFIHPGVSRSGLDRCLRRHGVSNLHALIPQPEGQAKPIKTFKDYAPGFGARRCQIPAPKA